MDAHRVRLQTYTIPYYARHPGYGFWAAVEKGAGAFLGWFHLRPALDYRFAAEAAYCLGDRDLGYRFRRAVWGRGYATEGSRALVREAFTVLEAACVVATALVGNRASTRVMEKAGLRRGAEFHIPGYDEPAVKYALERNNYDPQGDGGA